MRKLFAEKADKMLILTGDDHKHLSLVLRARPREIVIVSTGDGFDYSYEIDSISKTETILKLMGQAANVTEPAIDITLFTAILKGDKNETVVRMCTELGVKRICPIVTEHTVATRESYKTDRMRKIAEEASKQSGRGRIPEIMMPATFGSMAKLITNFELIVFPYESATDIGIKDFLCGQFNAAEAAHKKIRNAAVIVGSEGGFSKLESEVLASKGITPVSLGKRILRADTACVTTCAAVLYEAEEME